MTAATRQTPPPFEGVPPDLLDAPNPFEQFEGAAPNTPFPPGPSLEDAAIGGGPAAPAPAAETPKPITDEQIIGLVAQLSAFGMPPELAKAYAEEFASDMLVNFGVMASGLSGALAEYGMTANGGKLPAWLSVLLGVSVLGYGVYSIRGRYVQKLDPTAADGAPAGFFGVAGAGNPLQPNGVPLDTAGLGGMDV